MAIDQRGGNSRVIAGRQIGQGEYLLLQNKMNETPKNRNSNKALSIRQPWAWLIANNYKDVENRTWTTKHRGITLIHASKSFDRAGYQWVMESFPNIKLPAPSEFEYGGIVGQFDLTGCETRNVNSRWYEGKVAFLIANARPLPFHPCKGQLQFFRVELP